MGFAEVFGLIYSLLKAIPVLDKAVRAFFTWYTVKEKEWFYEEIQKAVNEAISTGQTGPLESAIGSPLANKPSNHAGAQYDDPSLP
jgi:hypothetical protein